MNETAQFEKRSILTTTSVILFSKKAEIGMKNIISQYIYIQGGPK